MPSLLLALPPEELPPSMPGMEPQAESRSRMLAIREKTILFLIITTPQFNTSLRGEDTALIIPEEERERKHEREKEKMLKVLPISLIWNIPHR